VEIPPGIRRGGIAIGAASAAAKDSLAVTILREAHHTFWTRSLWTDEAAMKAFMVSGAHRTIMPKLLEWCDEASVARWTQASAQEPAWRTCTTDAARRPPVKGQPSIRGAPPLRARRACRRTRRELRFK